MTTSSTSAVRLVYAEHRDRRDRLLETSVLLTGAARFARHMSAHVIRALRTWNTRLEDRHFLADLREYQIHEMGLTRADRDREVRKPIWQE